jgi:hypothetical protein
LLNINLMGFCIWLRSRMWIVPLPILYLCKTNVIGTMNLLNAAKRSGKMVLKENVFYTSVQMRFIA